MNTETNIYEVKVDRKWIKVRATSMIALNKWCESVGITEWRMCGMISIEELEWSKTLTVVG